MEIKANWKRNNKSRFFNITNMPLSISDITTTMLLHSRYQQGEEKTATLTMKMV